MSRLLVVVCCLAAPCAFGQETVTLPVVVPFQSVISALVGVLGTTVGFALGGAVAFMVIARGIRWIMMESPAARADRLVFDEWFRQQEKQRRSRARALINSPGWEAPAGYKARANARRNRRR